MAMSVEHAKSDLALLTSFSYTVLGWDDTGCACVADLSPLIFHLLTEDSS